MQCEVVVVLRLRLVRGHMRVWLFLVMPDRDRDRLSVLREAVWVAFIVASI